MLVPDINRLVDYWAEYPPVHVTLALRYRIPKIAREESSPDGMDASALFTMFGGDALLKDGGPKKIVVGPGELQSLFGPPGAHRG